MSSRLKLSFIVLISLCSSILASTFTQNFEYEYVLVLSYIYNFLFLAYSLFLIGFKNELSIETGKEYFEANAVAILTATLSSFALYFLSSCQCSKSSLGFWILMNFIPMSLMFSCLSIIISKSKTKYLSLLFLISAILLDLIFHLWMQPQKRISHWLIGFIHGPIYDRIIYFDSNIALSRSFFSLIAIYLALKATTNSKRTKIFERIISLSAILIFVSYIGNPSTANSKKP